MIKPAKVIGLFVLAAVGGVLLPDEASAEGGLSKKVRIPCDYEAAVKKRGVETKGGKAVQGLWAKAAGHWGQACKILVKYDKTPPSAPILLSPIGGCDNALTLRWCAEVKEREERARAADRAARDAEKAARAQPPYDPFAHAQPPMY